MDLQDPGGKYVIKDLIDIAKAGGGHYEYTWNNPATKKEEAKLSYAIGLNKWGWMIGTGTYLNHINQEIATIDQQITQQSTTLIIQEIVAALLIISIALFLV